MCFHNLLPSAPRAFFECGNSPLGFDGVGAPTLAPESLPCPPEGAESFEGNSLLSSFSGLREVGSPSRGGVLPELMASLVLGLSRVPRTVLEWGLDSPILCKFICIGVGVERWIISNCACKKQVDNSNLSALYAFEDASVTIIIIDL